MKLIYKPFGLMLGILAGLVGRKVFDQVWTKIDDQDPPKGTDEQATWPKIVAAAALQGVIFKVTRVVVDRYDETVGLGLRRREIAQVPDVQQVEVPVRERDGFAGGAMFREARRELVEVQDDAHRASTRGFGSDRIASRSSSRETVAVPIFMTTTPPA